ncbi:MAG TPA: hypothetical protein VLQ80_04715, partial [Candidatus Saccharimonadia bacterium]|nr:hypothetical protein [Candidatus Saccharimonadia bacterium]
MHLRYESRHFASNEELSSPSDAYPDAYGDKPGHDDESNAISQPLDKRSKRKHFLAFPARPSPPCHMGLKVFLSYAHGSSAELVPWI